MMGSLLLYSCTSDKKFIQGNWYYAYQDSIFPHYYESYFEEDTVTSYDGEMSSMISNKYFINNGKIYFYEVGGDLADHYIPEFVRHNRNSFSLVDTFSTQTFYRIPDYEFTIDEITSYEWNEYYVLSYYLRRFKHLQTRGYLLEDICYDLCLDYCDSLEIIPIGN